MRQLHSNENEPVQSGMLSQLHTALSSDQHAGVVPARDLLTKTDQSQYPSVEELLRCCSRDAPRIEALNFLTYLSSPVLFLLVLSFVGSGEGAAALVTLSSLIGMNYGMRRTIKRGIAKDAEEFAELGPESVGILLNCLGRSNMRVEAVAALVLAQLLPTLTREQFEALSEDQRTHLYLWLRDGSHTFADAKMSVLRWLADVADAEAVACIEYLAKRFSFSPTQRRLRAEARSVLSQILERLDNEYSAAQSNSAARSDSNANSILAEEDDLETTEEARALLTQIRKHSANRTSPAMRMGYLIANWCFITPYVGYKLCESVSLHNGLVTNVIWLILTAASTQLYRTSLTPAHTRMARQLAATSDTHAVGALAEALDWPDEEIQAIARGALLRMLPKLTTSDATLLNSRQRRCLNSRLVLTGATNYLDSELQVKILQAWEKVGDLSSLQAVKSLVAAKTVLPNERKVQKAAVKCLPILEERAHLNTSSQTLLRASSVTDSATETLVRPASANAEPDEELLRPTGEQE